MLADVDAATACLVGDAVAAVRTPRTRAVIVVHLYGYPAALPVTDLPIVEDAAQAHGALHDPSRSAATAYSFYPTKVLGGIGDGGAVVTDDAELDAMVRQLRVHGMTAQPYVHDADLAELPHVRAGGGVAAARPGRARRRRRPSPATIAAHLRAAAPTPPVAGTAPRPCVPSAACSAAPTETASGPGWRAAAWAPPCTTRSPSTSSRRTGTSTTAVCSHSAAMGSRVRQRAVLPGDDRRRDRSRRQQPSGRADDGSPWPGRTQRCTSVSAIFPCYNDEATIGGLVDDGPRSARAAGRRRRGHRRRRRIRRRFRSVARRARHDAALVAGHPPRAQRRLRAGA